MSDHLKASSSKSNQTGSGFQNDYHSHDDHDGPFLSPNSSFDLNHHSIGSSSAAAANTIPTHIGSRRILSSTTLSQLGLSKRVTEVRTSYTVPHRVHVHSVIDFLPVQNQTSDHLPLAEVTVTREIVRTQLLAPTSTMDRLFNIPRSDDHEMIRSQTRTFPVSNQVNHHHPFSFQMPEPLHDHHYFQNPSNSFAHFYTSMSRDIPSSSNLLQNPGYNNPQNPRANPPLIIRNISSREEVRFYFQSNISNVYPLQRFNPIESDTSDEDAEDDEEIEGDGRTHSLPYEKYGPYTCPKCHGVFDTSQSFAAHIGSHYKYETGEERRKRLAARRRRRNRRLFRPFGAGLPVVPDPWNVQENAAQIMNVKVEEKDDWAEEEDHEALMQQQAAPSPEQSADQEASLIGNKIKEEPLENWV